MVAIRDNDRSAGKRVVRSGASGIVRRWPRRNRDRYLQVRPGCRRLDRIHVDRPLLAVMSMCGSTDRRYTHGELRLLQNARNFLMRLVLTHRRGKSLETILERYRLPAIGRKTMCSSLVCGEHPRLHVREVLERRQCVDAIRRPHGQSRGRWSLVPRWRSGMNKQTLAGAPDF